MMYIGAALSMAACVGLIYVITASGDPTIEWMIWIFFGLTIALAAGGYLYETDHKQKHGDDRLSRYGEIIEGEV